MEVLLRAVHAQLGVQVLPGGAVAAELGEVGEQAEQLDLVGDHVDAGRDELVAGSEVVVDDVAVLAAGRRRSPSASRATSSRLRAARSCAEREPARTAAGRGPGPPRRERRPPRSRRPRRARDAPAGHRSRPGSRSAPGARGPGRRTAHAAPSPSSCSRAPGPERRPRRGRRPRPATRRPAPGAGERSTPPSSRLTRWATPSTSIMWTGPWVAVTSAVDAGRRPSAGCGTRRAARRRRPRRARRRPPRRRPGTGAGRSGAR